MYVFAATGNTWGINGPTFLGLYAALAAVAALATVLRRRSLTRSLAPAPRLDNPDDIAYLHGGPELTVLAELSAMSVAGRIASSGAGRVHAVGALEPDASELERAIHQSAQQLTGQAELRSAPPVAEALNRIERQLMEAGLLLTAEQRRRIRHTGWMLWAVVALGVIRAIAGGMAGKPIGLLLVLLVGVAVGAVLLSRAGPRRTDRGNAELTRLRSAHTSLSPRSRPDWAVYGPAGAALGVAVFGAGALWAAEPILATALGTRRSGITGSGGGYNYGCSGGGCGGGGCGGGGCGGGGCGG